MGVETSNTAGGIFERRAHPEAGQSQIGGIHCARALITLHPTLQPKARSLVCFECIVSSAPLVLKVPTGTRETSTTCNEVSHVDPSVRIRRYVCMHVCMYLRIYAHTHTYLDVQLNKPQSLPIPFWGLLTI